MAQCRRTEQLEKAESPKRPFNELLKVEFTNRGKVYYMNFQHVPDAKVKTQVAHSHIIHT